MNAKWLDIKKKTNNNRAHDNNDNNEQPESHTWAVYYLHFAKSVSYMTFSSKM